MSRNRARVEAAFAALEKRGIIARADFWCCNSCAGSALYGRDIPSWKGEEPPLGYVFFHEQATDSANEGGSLWLSHGSISEGEDGADNERIWADQQLVADMVVQEFRERGFEVDWDGDLGMKIAVREPRDGWDLDYDRAEDEEDEDEECSDCGGPLSWDGVCEDDCGDKDED